jgi:threonine dehydratase
VITLHDIFLARRRIAGRIRRTPLVRSDWLSDATGADVHLKLESLQITGSFKLRGALNACLALVESGVHTRPIVTASAGNHGRALAHACRELGLHGVVFTARDAARNKLDAIARLGAELHSDARSYEDTERRAKEHAGATGGLYLSPYSHPEVIAGAGTIAIEIFEEAPQTDLVLLPVGGGGLASGTGIAARALAAAIEVVGVETAASPAFHTSLQHGRVTTVQVFPTIADGLAGNMDPDTITFPIVQRVIDRVTLAAEEYLRAAVRELATREHVIAEGAGAAAVAALLAARAGMAGRKIVAIVTGANIDAATLASVLRGPT